MTVLLGIDPGATGAIAIDTDGDPDVRDMPLTGAGLQALLDAWGVSGWLSPTPIAYIEHQHAFPGQGSTSGFKLGMNYGGLIWALSALGWRVETVAPSVWKTALGLRGKDKEASRALAQRLFPQLADQLTRKKDHGRAEALLLLEYARRKEQGQ